MQVLKENALVSLDDMLNVVYKNFPNGLTPDENSILKSLKKFATKSSNAWVYSPNAIESKNATQHTLYISYLAKIGKKLGFDIFIGKREQRENIDNKKLSDYANIFELNFIKDDFTRQRALYIDILFVKNKSIHYAFEIENSTNIIEALHRNSVLESSIPKFIVIPNNREEELLGKKEPLFIESIQKNHWQYLLYSDIDKLVNVKYPRLEQFAKDIV
ncbi:hypothetical protein XJ32_07130 [Helicobacter bilis]|uniref:Restriction endonuclease n=1 Tax=Helicobacter bilis TaxID=37372 RepID=A0A1Q2LHF5_9HELI|nr:hypothetical protein [Helicobacter bilis]AQQ59894.1 hypothetical protein XJ32_07130 [Helicobacter bilis]